MPSWNPDQENQGARCAVTGTSPRMLPAVTSELPTSAARAHAMEGATRSSGRRAEVACAFSAAGATVRQASASPASALRDQRCCDCMMVLRVQMRSG